MKEWKRSKKTLNKLRLLSQKKRDQKRSLQNRNQKNPSTQKIKKIEKILSRLKKYHDYDDIEYRGTRDIKNLFDLSIGQDYYNDYHYAFNGYCIEYESKEDKNKTLSIKEC